MNPVDGTAVGQNLQLLLVLDCSTSETSKPSWSKYLVEGLAKPQVALSLKLCMRGAVHNLGPDWFIYGVSRVNWIFYQHGHSLFSRKVYHYN